MKKWKLIGSAPSIEAILKLIRGFYFSPSIELDQELENIWKVRNSRGVIDGVMVVYLKGRYRFEAVSHE